MDANELSRRMGDFYLVANETLHDVKDLTEQQIKHWIVSPFLVALGWDPRDKKQVFLDYPIGPHGHVDYALLDSAGKPRVLVDVKKPGESAGEPDETAKKAKQVQAPLVLLTNGREFSLWNTPTDAESATPLTFLSLKELPDNGESLLGLTGEYRGSDTGIQQLRRVAIRQAVLQLLEENSEKTFDAVMSWVRGQIAPNGGLDEATDQAVREATLMWLNEEHRSMPAFSNAGERRQYGELRSTTLHDWEPFPRGPAGTFQYRYDAGKTLDVRQSPKEVREALRNQGLRTSTATAFGGFYAALRGKAGLPVAHAA